MGRYILKRLFEGVVTLWLITLAVFFILRLGGGNPVEYMLPPEATQADIDKLTKAYGFDKQKPWSTVDDAGRETDFLKMMRIVLDAGYRGWVGIESEGRQNQMEGVRDTQDLLVRVRDKLQSEYAA